MENSSHYESAWVGEAKAKGYDPAERGQIKTNCTKRMLRHYGVKHHSGRILRIICEVLVLHVK